MAKANIVIDLTVDDQPLVICEGFALPGVEAFGWHDDPVWQVARAVRDYGVLQHRQLHRIFWTILCTAIYSTVLCLPFYAALCIARLLSGRCISTVRSYP